MQQSASRIIANKTMLPTYCSIPDYQRCAQRDQLVSSFLYLWSLSLTRHSRALWCHLLSRSTNYPCNTYKIGGDLHVFFLSYFHLMTLAFHHEINIFTPFNNFKTPKIYEWYLQHFLPFLIFDLSIRITVKQ